MRPVGSDSRDRCRCARIGCDQSGSREGCRKQGCGDLFYWLNVVQALGFRCARAETMLLLAQHFLQQTATRLGRSVESLKSQSSRTAVGHTAGRAMSASCKTASSARSLFLRLARSASMICPKRIRDYRPSQVLVPSDHPSELVTMDEIERRYILRVLDVVAGNKRWRRRSWL